MKIITSETQEPPPNAATDRYERGLDPWHTDAFPDELKKAGTTGERKTGWYPVDWCGNVIGFIADGTEMETSDKFRVLPRVEVIKL